MIRNYPLWTSRLKVSHASFMGILKMCIANFVRRPIAIRKPLDKDGLEDCARQASLVWALATELSMDIQASPGKIQQCWFIVFQEGDMNIELTLQQAIAEKKDNFTWKDVTELRELSQSHVQQVSTRMATNTYVEAEKLQEKNWKLFFFEGCT